MAQRWLRLVGVLLLCAGLPACTGLFFHPSSQPVMTPADVGLEYNSVSLQGEAGEIYGWWLPAIGENKGTVLFVHGNAGNISTHLGFVHWLPAEGYNVFLFDYRGYGRSAGEPDPLGLVDDTRRALAHVRQTPELASTGVVIYGHSLGGATAVTALAGVDTGGQVKGLVADSAFSNYRSIARDKLSQGWLTILLYPFVPLLITGEPDPLSDIARLSPLPVYLAHSRQDEIIPFHHSERLFERAAPPRFFYELKAGGHNHGWRNGEDRQWLLGVLSELLPVQAEVRLAVDETVLDE